MFSDVLRVAAVQYDIRGGLSFPQFIDKVESYVHRATLDGADLVVFPELFCGDLFTGNSFEDELRVIKTFADEDASRFFERVSLVAKKLRTAVLAGTVPRLVDHKIHNAAMLAFADGSSVFQDKVFPTSVERDWGWTGGQRLKAVSCPWGKTVIAICYDVEFPGLSAQIAHDLPELILVPSCTGGIEGFHRVRWTAQARAIEHFSYVVHVGTVGPGATTPNMNSNYGQASVLTPSEPGFPRILAEGPLNEAAIVHAELNLSALRKGRLAAKAYPARDELAAKKTGVKQ